jgi:hypothetical protein
MKGLQTLNEPNFTFKKEAYTFNVTAAGHFSFELCSRYGNCYYTILELRMGKVIVDQLRLLFLWMHQHAVLQLVNFMVLCLERLRHKLMLVLNIWLLKGEMIKHSFFNFMENKKQKFTLILRQLDLPALLQ